MAPLYVTDMMIRDLIRAVAPLVERATGWRLETACASRGLIALPP